MYVISLKKNIPPVARPGTFFFFFFFFLGSSNVGFWTSNLELWYFGKQRKQCLAIEVLQSQQSRYSGHTKLIAQLQSIAIMTSYH